MAMSVHCCFWPTCSYNAVLCRCSVSNGFGCHDAYLALEPWSHIHHLLHIA